MGELSKKVTCSHKSAIYKFVSLINTSHNNRQSCFTKTTAELSVQLECKQPTPGCCQNNFQ